MSDTTLNAKTLAGQRDAANLPYDDIEPSDFRPDPAGRANHVQHRDGEVYHVTTLAWEYLTGLKSKFVDTTVPVSPDTTIQLQRKINELEALLQTMQPVSASPAAPATA